MPPPLLRYTIRNDPPYYDIRNGGGGEGGSPIPLNAKKSTQIYANVKQFCHNVKIQGFPGNSCVFTSKNAFLIRAIPFKSVGEGWAFVGGICRGGGQQN